MTPDVAETIAVKALVWIAERDELASSFLGASGATADELRERAQLRRAVPPVGAVHERRVAAGDALRRERAAAQHRANLAFTPPLGMPSPSAPPVEPPPDDGPPEPCW